MVQEQYETSIFDIRLRPRTLALVSLLVLAGLLAIVPNAKAQTFSVLYNFNATGPSATFPRPGLGF